MLGAPGRRAISEAPSAAAARRKGVKLSEGHSETSKGPAKRKQKGSRQYSYIATFMYSSIFILQRIELLFHVCFTYSLLCDPVESFSS